MRLLQQTVRSSQYDKYFASSRLCDGVPQDTLQLLHQKDDQILGLASQLDRLSLEKESLQQEVRTLKSKVGELNEQLGMLMETIQAKDEVIIKLSRRLSECESGAAPPAGAPGSPTAGPAPRDQLELDRLKVRAGVGSGRRDQKSPEPLPACRRHSRAAGLWEPQSDNPSCPEELPWKMEGSPAMGSQHFRFSPLSSFKAAETAFL